MDDPLPKLAETAEKVLLVLDVCEDIKMDLGLFYLLKCDRYAPY